MKNFKSNILIYLAKNISFKYCISMLNQLEVTIFENQILIANKFALPIRKQGNILFFNLIP